MLGEWSENLKAFWSGANGCEFIAWKGSENIFVYSGYNRFPEELIQHCKRIETLADFDDAMLNGKRIKAIYSEIGE